MDGNSIEIHKPCHNRRLARFGSHNSWHVQSYTDSPDNSPTVRLIPILRERFHQRLPRNIDLSSGVVLVDTFSSPRPGLIDSPGLSVF
jgi:hypothetical protein